MISTMIKIVASSTTISSSSNSLILALLALSNLSQGCHAGDQNTAKEFDKYAIRHDDLKNEFNAFKYDKDNPVYLTVWDTRGVAAMSEKEGTDHVTTFVTADTLELGEIDGDWAKIIYPEVGWVELKKLQTFTDSKRLSNENVRKSLFNSYKRVRAKNSHKKDTVYEVPAVIQNEVNKYEEGSVVIGRTRQAKNEQIAFKKRKEDLAFARSKINGKRKVCDEITRFKKLKQYVAPIGSMIKINQENKKKAHREQKTFQNAQSAIRDVQSKMKSGKTVNVRNAFQNAQSRIRDMQNMLQSKAARKRMREEKEQLLQNLGGKILKRFRSGKKWVVISDKAKWRVGWILKCELNSTLDQVIYHVVMRGPGKKRIQCTGTEDSKMIEKIIQPKCMFATVNEANAEKWNRSQHDTKKIENEHVLGNKFGKSYHEKKRSKSAAEKMKKKFEKKHPGRSRADKGMLKFGDWQKRIENQGSQKKSKSKVPGFAIGAEVIYRKTRDDEWLNGTVTWRGGTVFTVEYEGRHGKTKQTSVRRHGEYIRARPKRSVPVEIN